MSEDAADSDARADRPTRRTALTDPDPHPAIAEHDIDHPEKTLARTRFGAYYQGGTSAHTSFSLLICPLCLVNLSGHRQTADHFRREHDADEIGADPASSDRVPGAGGGLRAD